MYEVLPATAKSTFREATQALHQRLYPAENEALVSAQLMRHKQRSNESGDKFAQDLEKLFERSCGHRHGMDEASKATLKRDVFVLICPRAAVEMAEKCFPLPRLSVMPCTKPEQLNRGSTSCHCYHLPSKHNYKSREKKDKVPKRSCCWNQRRRK